MPKRAFFDNLATILLFAVVGTFFNTICIGFTLYGLGAAGIGIIGNELFLINQPSQSSCDCCLVMESSSQK